MVVPIVALTLILVSQTQAFHVSFIFIKGIIHFQKCFPIVFKKHTVQPTCHQIRGSHCGHVYAKLNVLLGIFEHDDIAIISTVAVLVWAMAIWGLTALL